MRRENMIFINSSALEGRGMTVKIKSPPFREDSEGYVQKLSQDSVSKSGEK